MDFLGFKIFYSGIFWIGKCSKYFLGGLGTVHTYTPAPSLTENGDFLGSASGLAQSVERFTAEREVKGRGRGFGSRDRTNIHDLKMTEK